ncbi:uncharacterized protein [Coffea arabica]|uniref:Uncharacterized protein isoform X1 n=1 Tax=Coffea arabica TaxID=13443 RepID=A0ABM4UIV4_COFAR|nr:A-agglutinin anchorage subunit-like isoform X1 [Coffea arabica]
MSQVFSFSLFHIRTPHLLLNIFLCIYLEVLAKLATEPDSSANCRRKYRATRRRRRASVAREKEAEVQNKIPHHKVGKLQAFLSISPTEKDITTPITTLPTTNPLNPTATNPTLNPTVSNPDSASTTTNPANPLMTTSPLSSSASWCIASQSASQTALQVALDYACGYGGADCQAIQAGGNCYYPNTVHDHASYAFNSYYQKNPIPNSCNFGGTAVPTSTDPSYGTCQFQSTSTSSSILNTTNSMGSRVYGAGPITPTSSGATLACCMIHLHILTFLLTFAIHHSQMKSVKKL